MMSSAGFVVVVCFIEPILDARDTRNPKPLAGKNRKKIPKKNLLSLDKGWGKGKPSKTESFYTKMIPLQPNNTEKTSEQSLSAKVEWRV